MPELSIFEIVKNSIVTLTSSKVFTLILLEISILLVSLTFSKLMDKETVKKTSIISSLIILGFYITNYIKTLNVFIDNVSTKVMEILYFPTTLEFIIVMSIGIIIMIATLKNKKINTKLKVVNSVIPLSISFIFLGIIEYINTNHIEFDEFSTFTNPMLMSLYELAMGLFMIWMIGLLLYKANKMVIDRVSIPKLKEESSLVTVNLTALDDFKEDSLVTVNLAALDEEDDVEVPRLKTLN